MTNIQVDNAVNGEEAVEKFAASDEGYYDLILMDIQMPVLNGYEASRKLRGLNHPQASSIPVIAMTANAFDEDVANALAAGMNGHIPKPINLNLLFDTLGKHLGQAE